MSLSDRIMGWLAAPKPKLGQAGPPFRNPGAAPVLTDIIPAPAPPSGVPVRLDRLQAQLELHEGRRERIYIDTVGKVSGGIGRNLTDKGLRADEIDLMYQNDVAEAIAELDRVLPWWRQLDEVRARVMVDMMFNMGAPVLTKFANTLAAIRTGRYREAAEGMLASKWAQQTGARARRLAAMMGSGMDWTT